jgi:hypothetical protein
MGFRCSGKNYKFIKPFKKQISLYPSTWMNFSPWPRWSTIYNLWFTSNTRKNKHWRYVWSISTHANCSCYCLTPFSRSYCSYLATATACNYFTVIFWNTCYPSLIDIEYLWSCSFVLIHYFSLQSKKLTNRNRIKAWCSSSWSSFWLT